MKKNQFTQENRIRKAKIIEKILSTEISLKNKTLLDLGSGTGFIGKYFEKICDVYYADISDKRSFKDDKFIKIDKFEKVLTKKKFDIIISNHVVEHTNNPEVHFKELQRLLKEDGVIYLSFPNPLFPIETHTKIPFLHFFLSRSRFIGFSKKIRRYGESNLRFIYPYNFNKISKNFKKKQMLKQYIKIRFGINVVSSVTRIFFYLMPVSIFLLKPKTSDYNLKKVFM